MKVYTLEKDLPDSKVGDKYMWVNEQEAYYKNGDVSSSYWTKEFVENNPSWFKKDECKRNGIEDIAISFTQRTLSKVDSLLSEDYKVGFKEGVQKYIEEDVSRTSR